MFMTRLILELFKNKNKEEEVITPKRIKIGDASKYVGDLEIIGEFFDMDNKYFLACPSLFEKNMPVVLILDKDGKGLGKLPNEEVKEKAQRIFQEYKNKNKHKFID